MSHPKAVRGLGRSRVAFACMAIAAALVVTPVTNAAAIDTTAPAVSAVDATGSSFTLSASELQAESVLTIDYTTDQQHPQNWIGIYTDGDEPGPVASTLWQYSPDASGSAAFTLSLPAGIYHVWFLAQDGYAPLAERQTFTVIADPDAPAPGDPNAPVEIDPVVTDITTDGVILREGFTVGSTPVGWSTESDADMADAGSDAYRGWQFTTRTDWTSSVDEMRKRFGRSHDAIAVADAQQFGDHPFASTLTSEAVAVTDLGAVRLTFDSHYRGASGQSGVVRASFDGAAPIEVLRLDEASVTSGYDGIEMNGAHDLSVDVPARASSVVFSWEFTGGADSLYWAIDSVMVHQVLTATLQDPTQAWVVSDIQGHPQDFANGLEGFREIAPDADGLLMVGDIVNSGESREWDEIYDVMEGSADFRPDQTIAAIGNHERYAAGGFAANFQRFLDFAEREKSWGEYVLDGPSGEQPVIVLGQEFAAPSDVAMSEEQLRFFEERLAHWTALDKQVVVISHFPLGDTVSASWIPWYSTHHQHNDRLTSILGNYPNAIIFSGHTHYPAELGDWAMQRRTADGHSDGFWAINTLAMHIEWDARGENTDGITEVTTGDVNRGLTLDSYGDRIVVTAYDFASDQQLRQITIPNPLVPFSAVVAPDADRSADYSAVDSALISIPTDLSAYTAKSVAALNRAVKAVDRSLTAYEQHLVDAMAQAIRDAIAALVPGSNGDGGHGNGQGNGQGKGQGGGRGNGPGTAASEHAALPRTGAEAESAWRVSRG
ncbi:DUF4073 domain-containing protein [Mycetocola sp.]|uniref:DUF4073 domain-containing protein n=1 Tax=Mycetocola sp. TaxID=1871042 RepID=UPI003988D6AE